GGIQRDNAVTAVCWRATVLAVIVVVGISVVALLTVARLRDSVAAHWQGTRVRAAVVVYGVGVIALLHAGPHEPVTAERLQAARDASVRVAGIAVVALLHARIFEPVAAGRIQTVRTRVGGVPVSVVTLLDPGLKEPISACSDLAGNASVGVDR